MRDRYFDNAATTPLDPRVLVEMLPFLGDDFGNAHSIHGFGLRAMAAVELARERIAALINAEDPSQIVFTSGATEANNWVIQRAAGPGSSISPYEHSSVREPALAKGLTILDPALPTPASTLVSVMSVNNETGMRLDVRDFPAQVRHADITQQVGKLATDVEGLDFASFSAHKFYGPKGIGALYSAETPPAALLLGGEQEHGHRAGTLNVPAIVGMGAAAAIAADEQEDDERNASTLRAILLEQLESVADIQVNGTLRAGAMKAQQAGSPYILNLSILGIEGETLVIEADHAGFAISAGAACSSRSTEPSHVLTALGVPTEWLRGAIRISFGRTNTADSTQALGKALQGAINRLRNR